MGTCAQIGTPGLGHMATARIAMKMSRAFSGLLQWRGMMSTGASYKVFALIGM